MTPEQVQARIDALEKQRADLALEINRLAQLQSTLNAVEGALIVLREVLAPTEPPTQQA